MRRRIQAGNRHCAHLLEPEIFTGPAFAQRASGGSTVQKMLIERAEAVIDQFERSVQLVPNELLGEEIWTVAPHRPGGAEMLPFKNAAHARYSAKG